MTHALEAAPAATLGLARVRDDDTLTSTIERADRALYEGKQAGRDRYVIADERGGG